MDVTIPPRPAGDERRVALLLQGGGALGSFQAGVYAALNGTAYEPDWVSGISIGAINAAIIAGNAPERRVEKLRAFWEQVSTPNPPGAASTLNGTAGRGLGAAQALLFGQSGFFAPRAPGAWWGAAPTSFYDTAALRGTLERLVDFDRIAAGPVRLSVGAVNLRTAQLVHFDSANRRITPDHVMASGALPPGFPAVEIDGEAYWDGGLVSNTPLQYVLTQVPRRSRIAFQVDVFPAAGPLPRDLSEVAEREKDIRYSSRTQAATELLARLHDLRHNINRLLERLPPELRALPEAEFLYRFGCVTRMDIVQLGYAPKQAQGPSKDYEFSRATMRRRWAEGEDAARRMLAASPWLAPMDEAAGARVFDLSHDEAVAAASWSADGRLLGAAPTPPAAPAGAAPSPRRR
jgi:NTE family protein